MGMGLNGKAWEKGKPGARGMVAYAGHRLRMLETEQPYYKQVRHYCRPNTHYLFFRKNNSRYNERLIFFFDLKGDKSMVEIKTFIEGFRDLEKLYEVKHDINKAKYKIKRALVDTSLGCLDDRSILTDEERARFFKLSDALNDASELLTDKIAEQQEKCIRMNVIGFTEEVLEEDKKEENEFF